MLPSLLRPHQVGSSQESWGPKPIIVSRSINRDRGGWALSSIPALLLTTDIHLRRPSPNPRLSSTFPTALRFFDLQQTAPPLSIRSF